MKILAHEFQNLPINENKNLDNKTPFSEIKNTTNTDIDFLTIKTEKIELMGDSSSHELIKKRHASNIIKNFLRKIIAAQSYGHMFANGKNFKKLDIHYTPVSKKNKQEKNNTKSPFSFRTLDHLENISQDYLNEIKNKTNKLSVEEKELVSRISNIEWHFRHQSNAHFPGPSLTLYSHKRLNDGAIAAGCNTTEFDLENLSNNDFVFFAVEFSNLKEELPLNRRHNGHDLGANAFILDEKNPSIKSGYLTLTDHHDNFLQSVICHREHQEHKDWVKEFPETVSIFNRFVHGDKGISDVPIYSAKHMKEAIALHLINFLRYSLNAKFKAFVLNSSITAKQLDRVLNFVFQAEFHVPRILSTASYKKVSLYDMTYSCAVDGINIHELDKVITDKDAACEALFYAIKVQKKTAIAHLTDKWTFTAADFKGKEYFQNLEFYLSRAGSDTDVLNLFLSRGFAQPNTLFPDIHKGETMLDNAIAAKNKKMITLLKANGAKTGEEIRAENRPTSL